MLRTYRGAGRLLNSSGGNLAKKTTARKTSARKNSTSKRELIDTGKNKMFAKRRTDGTFREMDDVGRSLSADRRRTAKKSTKSGYGDQGDRFRGGNKKKWQRSRSKGIIVLNRGIRNAS